MFDFLKNLFKKSSVSSPKEKKCPSTVCKKAETCPKRETCPRAIAMNNTCVTTSQNTETVVADIVAEPVMEIKTEAPIEEKSVEKREAPIDEALSEKNTEGAYVIKLSKSGIYKFELVSPEGKMIVRSGEYTLKRSCVSGIQSVRKNGSTENIEDQTVEKPVKTPNPKFEVFTDEASKYRFSLKAPNGYVILTSSAYASKKSCMKAIENVRAYSSAEKVEEPEKSK